MKPLLLRSRFWKADRMRLRRSSRLGPPATSFEKGGCASLRNSSRETLPSLLVSRSSNDFMRYFRKSARETSPFLAVSISTNQDGNGTAAGPPDGVGGGPGFGPVVWACASAGSAASRHSRIVVLITLPQLPGAFVGKDRRLRHLPSVENRRSAIYRADCCRVPRPVV